MARLNVISYTPHVRYIREWGQRKWSVRSHHANPFTRCDLSPRGERDAVCDEGDPRRPRARPSNGRGDRSDLHDVDVQPESPTGVGLRPDGEPDAGGPRAEPRGPRGGQARPVLQLRDGRDHDNPHAPEEG